LSSGRSRRETFEYRFVVPDAGTFWYHSHRNETVQMERGLYGALVVRGTEEPVVDREQVLVLDDIKAELVWGLAKFGGRKERHYGREGSVRLLNGRAEPELTIASGQTERWRNRERGERALRASVVRRQTISYARHERRTSRERRSRQTLYC